MLIPLKRSRVGELIADFARKMSPSDYVPVLKLDIFSKKHVHIFAGSNRAESGDDNDTKFTFTSLFYYTTITSLFLPSLTSI